LENVGEAQSHVKHLKQRSCVLAMNAIGCLCVSLKDFGCYFSKTLSNWFGVGRWNIRQLYRFSFLFL